MTFTELIEKAIELSCRESPSMMDHLIELEEEIAIEVALSNRYAVCRRCGCEVEV